MGDAPGKDESADPGAGVFGNLPSSRPGTRSPRRRSAAGEQPAARSKAAAKAASPKPAAAPSAPRPDPVADAEAVAAATTPPAAGKPGSDSEPEGPAEESNRSGLEDIAWAGVAAAADAATIGVRLASRALERLRDGVDPR